MGTKVVTHEKLILHSSIPMDKQNIEKRQWGTARPPVGLFRVFWAAGEEED